MTKQGDDRRRYAAIARDRALPEDMDALKQQLAERGRAIKLYEEQALDRIHQLAECREERDKLRNTHQQVIAWMKQTDGAMPMADVIKILEADLEATP